MRVSYLPDNNNNRDEQVLSYKNDPEKSYYVYVHFSELDGKPYYVGKGSRYRAWQVAQRNPYWQAKYRKHGCRVDIVFSNLTEAESFRAEIDTILELRYFGYDLCNLTSGGEGCRGFKQSPEVVANRVQKNTGKVRTPEQRKRLSDSNKGKTRTEETRLKISKAFKGTKRDPEVVKRVAEKNIGQRRSEQTKIKMSQSATERALVQDLATKMLGNRNPSADRRVYTVENVKTGETFTGTRCDIYTQYNLKTNSLAALFRGQREIMLGWKLIGVEDDKGT